MKFGFKWTWEPEDTWIYNVFFSLPGKQQIMAVLVSCYTDCRHPECHHFILKTANICDGFPRLYIINEWSSVPSWYLCKTDKKNIISKNIVIPITMSMTAKVLSTWICVIVIQILSEESESSNIFKLVFPLHPVMKGIVCCCCFFNTEAAQTPNSCKVLPHKTDRLLQK